jgi:hypothetical protein
LPLWIVQLGDVVVTPDSSYIMPFGALRRIIAMAPSLSKIDPKDGKDLCDRAHARIDGAETATAACLAAVRS